MDFSVYLKLNDELERQKGVIERLKLTADDFNKRVADAEAEYEGILKRLKAEQDTWKKKDE